MFTSTEGKHCNLIFCELQEHNGCDLGFEGDLIGDETRKVSQGWVRKDFSVLSTSVVPGTMPVSGRFKVQ